MKEKWLNSIALVGFIRIVSSWAWWLFRPQPMPFTLRARWKVQDIVTDGIAFSPNGDWLAASVLTSQQGQLTLTVQLWQVPKTQTNPKVFSVSQQVQPMGISSPQLGFSPDGRLLAVGYLEQGVGKVALFTVPEGRRLWTVTVGKSQAMLTPTVSFTPDGRQVAVGYDLPSTLFVQVSDGRKARSKVMPNPVFFSPDGRFTAACYATEVINIYDAQQRRIQQIKLPPRAALNFRAVAFSKDGQRFVCLWYLRQPKTNWVRWGISIWRTADWRLEQSRLLMPFFEDFFTSFAASLAPDLSLAMFVEPDPSGLDGTLWRLERFVWRLLGRHIPSAPPSQVVVRRLSDGQIVAKLPRFGRRVWDCAFSPDGRYLAVSHGDFIALWERKGD
jgi:WD40 repeat protein